MLSQFTMVFVTVLDDMSRLHTKTFYRKRLCMLSQFTTVMKTVFIGLHYVVILRRFREPSLYV